MGINRDTESVAFTVGRVTRQFREFEEGDSELVQKHLITGYKV